MIQNAPDNHPPRIGGQAIIEGVMMRGPEQVSAAVRLPSGEIEQRIWPSRAWSRRHSLLGLPVIRGMVGIAEALTLGIRTLNWSAEIAMEQERMAAHQPAPQRRRRLESLGLSFSLLMAALLAILIFMLIPYELASLLKADRHQPLFHLIAGATRITLFLVYLWGISYLKEIRRVFEYHGAEHKAIFTYEKQRELTPERALLESRFHPRCGTSFLLIVALLTMVIFVVFDVFVVSVWGNYPNSLMRLLVHLPFLPLVAGISYEFLRLSDRFSDSAIVQVLIAPGLALQKITTRLPDLSQVEVALSALEAALPASQREQHTEKSAANF